jgi:hypothetical protein
MGSSFFDAFLDIVVIRAARRFNIGNSAAKDAAGDASKLSNQKWRPAP